MILSKYLNALKSERFHIQSLRWIIVFLLVIVGYLGFVVQSLPRQLTIYNPPDLRTGSVRNWWEIPPSTVYAFSLYTFQQLNRWQKDGEVDYLNNIETLRPFMTPGCYNYLKRDYDNRSLLGELKGRERSVYEMPGRGYEASRVQVNSDDSWFVNLDLYTDEYFGTERINEKVKRVLVRYPLHIVRMDTDPQNNPWGLGLDCYRGQPQRIELKSAEQTQQGQAGGK